MFNANLVRDRNGVAYKILLSRDKPAPGAVEARRFQSEREAIRFINNLVVPTNFWKNIYRTDVQQHKPVISKCQLKHHIARLFMQGRIKAYKIDITSQIDHSPAKRCIQGPDKTRYTFLPASSLVVATPKELLPLYDAKSARGFLNDRNLSQEDLKNLSESLKLMKQPDGTIAQDETLNQLSESLAKGSIVIAVDRYTKPPKPQSSDSSEVFVDKKAEPGPAPDDKKDINITLFDEFENNAAASLQLLNGLSYELETDQGDKFDGTIENGSIQIKGAKMGQGYTLKIKDMPAYLDM